MIPFNPPISPFEQSNYVSIEATSLSPHNMALTGEKQALDLEKAWQAVIGINCFHQTPLSLRQVHRWGKSARIEVI